jgi:META domain
MKNVAIAAFIILLMAQCSQRKLEVSPTVAKLIGTWQLIEPDSTYTTTLVFVLDTANPPRDVIHFLANGKSAINTYNAFLSAAVDGFMVVTDVGSTKIGGSPDATKAEQTYLTNLRAVVRYDMPADNRLQLYHGGDKPGKLVYRRID